MFRLKSGIKTAALITAFILSTGAIVSCGGQENNNSLPDSSSDTASDKKFVNSEKINEVLPGIVCWGDSLTSGPGGNAMSYPTALQNYIDDSISVMCPEAKELGISIPVVNMGVGGEDTNTILGRNGAVPFITSSAFTIPAEEKSVAIKFISENGNPVAPLIQGNAGMEFVTIGRVKGVISRSGNGYVFTRSEAGDPVQISKGTEIITAGSEPYREYIAVIFIGQNGGFTSYDELVEQQKAIINHQTKNKDKYIIIGLHTTTPSCREDLEGLMLEEYGDKYINLREYMSTDAMKNADLTPTQSDISAMEGGNVPPSLLSTDMLHFNSDGYEIIGKLVYDRMEQLGYFDVLKDLLTESD